MKKITNKTRWLGALVVLALLVTFNVGSYAFAQVTEPDGSTGVVTAPATPAPAATGAATAPRTGTSTGTAGAKISATQKVEDLSTSELVTQINQIFGMVLKLSSAWLWPVILMTGSLLDNDLIFGGAMGEKLLGIWVQFRNLVNILFVVILLAIAIYNVLGLGEEGGGLPLAFKTVLPKFVLALVAVNFSFLAARVVLDFTNVLTGVVFSLPTTVATDSQFEFDKKAVEVICGNNDKDAPMRALWCNGNKLNERADAFFSRVDRSNITVAYAMRFGQAANLKYVRDGIKGITQLGFNIIFNTVLYVVYALSFIALFLVLLVRLVVLWVGVVFSPLIALTIVLPNLKELAGSGGKLQETFVKHAIAPIKIGLVLSIGYIMLDAFQADPSIHGDTLSSVQLDAVDPLALPTDILDLQQLMIAVVMVVIVWTGVFEAAEETAAKGVTGFIKENTTRFGKWVAKLPTYAQIIPTGGKFGQDHVSFQEAKATVFDQVGKFNRKYGSPIGEAKLTVEDLKPWQELSTAVGRDQKIEKLAEAIAKKPFVLQDPEIFKGTFKEAFMAATGMDSKKFDSEFEGKYSEKVARAIEGDTNLMDRIRAKDKSIVSGAVIHDRVTQERSPLLSADKKTPADFAKDLAKDSSLTGADLVRRAEYSEFVGNPKELDEIKNTLAQASPRVLEAALKESFDPATGKVKRDLHDIAAHIATIFKAAEVAAKTDGSTPQPLTPEFKTALTKLQGRSSLLNAIITTQDIKGNVKDALEAAAGNTAAKKLGT